MFQKYVLENISVALHSHFTIHKLHFLASTEYRDMLQTAVQSCEHGHHGSWQVISPNWVLHTFLNLFYKYAYSWIHEHMHACTYTHRIGGRGLKHYVQQMRSSPTQVELMITQSQRKSITPSFQYNICCYRDLHLLWTPRYKVQ